MKMTKKGFTLVELMVVIVIVGILAAVAIPKFTMAAHKAKASEFPTVLMQVYTAEIAYEAEAGIYSDYLTIGVNLSEVNVASKWFVYTITPTSTTFIAQALVQNGGFGSAEDGMTAQINQSSTRTGSTDLVVYTTNWP